MGSGCVPTEPGWVLGVWEGGRRGEGVSPTVLNAARGVPRASPWGQEPDGSP